MSQPSIAEKLAARRADVKDIAGRLYRGEAGVDVVGKRRTFYIVAGVILLVAVVTFMVRPFNLGIEFKGGNAFTLPASVGTLAEVRGAFEESGIEVASAQVVGGATNSYLIKTPELDPDPAAASQLATEIKADLAERFDIAPGQISESAVSGAWGAQITQRALIGTVIFLILVVAYLALVFREWRMAVAALAALVQNLVLTAAIYLLVGFEVTPSTVIGFLTILGFALYDVVVVFDKVRENTRGITGNPNRTYGEAANLAVNQTLMRSINTAVVALLPVGGLLFIGAGLLGAGTLKDLGLVLFVGMLAAVYSSIFFATPVLVDLVEAQPKYQLHKQRVLSRRASGTSGGRRPVKAAPRQPAAVAGVPSRGSQAAVGRGGAAGRSAGQKAAGQVGRGSGQSPSRGSSDQGSRGQGSTGQVDGEPADGDDADTFSPAKRGGGDAPDEAALAAGPRVGARPQARRRPGAGSKPGSKSGGGRSGGRKR